MAITNYLNNAASSTDGTCTHHVINQGDSYDIPVFLSVEEEQNDETVLTPFSSEDVPLIDSLVFNIGKCVERKEKAADCWDDTVGAFLFHLEQADTLKLVPGVYKFDCTVYFINGDAIAISKKDEDGNDARIFIHIIENERKQVIM